MRLWVNLIHSLQYMRNSCGTHALPPGCAALDLLAKLLTYDPAGRLTAQLALAHPFFAEVGFLILLRFKRRSGSARSARWRAPSLPWWGSRLLAC